MPPLLSLARAVERIIVKESSGDLGPVQSFTARLFWEANLDEGLTLRAWREDDSPTARYPLESPSGAVVSGVVTFR